MRHEADIETRIDAATIDEDAGLAARAEKRHVVRRTPRTGYVGRVAASRARRHGFAELLPQLYPRSPPVARNPDNRGFPRSHHGHIGAVDDVAVRGTS
jgi:hypothetical protein